MCVTGPPHTVNPQSEYMKKTNRVPSYESKEVAKAKKALDKAAAKLAKAKEKDWTELKRKAKDWVDAWKKQYGVPLLDLVGEAKAIVKAASKTVKKAGRKKGTKQVKLVEADVLKFISSKEVGYKDVASHFKKSDQTTKLWLDKCKALSKRNEDPKNKKSKVLYKVK